MLQRPRGTADVLDPKEAERWQWLESTARRVCARAGFSEVRTPTFEATELFARTSGESSDVVQKEMYTFQDQGGRALTLRPESTASVVRAYQEAKLSGVHKFYYLQAHFRYERPQKGRLREHHQFGCEILGTDAPLADAELIGAAWTFLSEAGLGDLMVSLNSIGDPNCRPAYRQALQAYYRPHQAELCTDCQRRLEDNPLRLLDCKQDGCQALKTGAPKSRQYLCSACQEHFREVLRLLDQVGIRHKFDDLLVRGLDYYTRTVFAISHAALGAQSDVCGGGRYDQLSEAIGGEPLPGVGFGLGLERLLISLGESDRVAQPVRLYLAVTSEQMQGPALALAMELRRSGLTVEVELARRSLKAQFRRADKEGFSHVGVFGPDEMASGALTVRDLLAGKESRHPTTELANILRTGAPAL